MSNDTINKYFFSFSEQERKCRICGEIFFGIKEICEGRMQNVLV